VIDPASDWPLFAENARELLTVSKVGVMSGCWTSVSRKSVLPVIKELNGLLFYPVQYDDEEWSKIKRDVLASGAAGKKVGVISTSNSDATIGFHQELAAAGV
jgi:urea transport system substrate-binding protein